MNRTATGTVKEPLFVKYSGSEYKLMIPDNGTLDFKTGASALVACTSDTKPNYLDYSKSSQHPCFDPLIDSYLF